MIETNSLRQKILDLAIRGKLTQQLDSDGTAKDLLAKIKAEKQKLTTEGKIKKEKPLAPITDDEKPFEIPENWEWVRLSEISKVITKGTTPIGGNVAYTENGIGFLRAENIAGFTKIDKCNLKYIDEITHNGFLARSILQAGDILITIAGTLGRTAIVCKEDLPLNANQAVCAVRLTDLNLHNLDFVVYALNSPIIHKILTMQERVTAIPNLTLSIISDLLIPYPPLAEQKRIVEIIESLDEKLQLIDSLQLSCNQDAQILKSKLISAAIQGKLTEQLPSDGTAKDLLAKIKAEKQKLIAEGKIKKEKPLAPITDDEKPFEIPENWEWAYIGDIFQHNTGKALNASDKNGELKEYITTSNLYWNRFELAKLKKMPFTEKEIEKCTVVKGDILVCEGGDYGRCAIWRLETPILIQNHIHRLRAYYEICSEYFYYIFYLYKQKNLISGQGIGIQGLSSNALHNMLVPLPPLAEQKRIVEKLEELATLCGDFRE